MAILDYFGNPDDKTVNASEHRRARAHPGPFAREIAGMLTAWEAYAKAHKTRYESSIGDDYVMGEYWANVGLAIKRLLDGECGGLDCGSLARNITEAITAEGIETDGYNVIGSDDAETP